MEATDARTESTEVLVGPAACLASRAEESLPSESNPVKLSSSVIENFENYNHQDCLLYNIIKTTKKGIRI